LPGLLADREVSMRGIKLLLAVMVLALVLCSAAFASGPTYPVVGDYTTSVNGFLAAMAPIVNGLLPYALAIFAVFFGPTLVFKLLKKFGRG
jgi:hypothetical protein